MVDIGKCRSIIVAEGASRAALFRNDECIAGYVEYRGRVFSIAIYEYRDIGIFVAKVALEPYSNICSDALYDPRGLMAYASADESLCRAIAAKVKRCFEIYREDEDWG